MIRGAAPSQNRLARSTAFKTNIYINKIMSEARKQKANIDTQENEMYLINDDLVSCF